MGRVREWEKDRPRSTDGGLGHDELMERWMEIYPNRVFSRGDWWVYGDGYWQKTSEMQIRRDIYDILEHCTEEGVKPTGNLLTSVYSLAKARTFVSDDIWDVNHNILVLGDCTLEIDTRTPREHRPEDYQTGALPYNYDPDAEPTVFLHALRKAIPDAEEFLQEFAGYSLTPDTHHETAIWFVGPRGSGKSTLIEGLKALLGPRAGLLGLAEIENSSYGLSRIPGKTLLVSTEQPSSYLKSTHIVDALISGEEITVERKYHHPYDYAPIAKIVWAMNDKPRIGNTTSGIFRRVKVVEFPHLPPEERDPDVKEEIKEEGPGLLNWALAGLDRLEERGAFDIPQSVRQATEEFEKSNDIPGQFVEEMCVVEAGAEVFADTFYSNYKKWCEDSGYKPMSKNRVRDDWKRLGFTSHRSSGGRRKGWECD
jgi:putative DNA primase/helicase